MALHTLASSFRALQLNERKKKKRSELLNFNSNLTQLEYVTNHRSDDNRGSSRGVHREKGSTYFAKNSFFFFSFTILIEKII